MDATTTKNITRLPTGGTRDYMVFLDGRPTTRTHRLADARQAAQAHFHRRIASATSPSDARARITSAVSR